MKKTKYAILLLAAAAFFAVSAGAQTTYFNDFTSGGFPSENGPWTLDTGNGVNNYFQPTGDGSVTGTASAQVPGAVGSDLTVSTRFTVNSLDAAALTITSGFGAFSNTDDFSGTYYLADWFVDGSNVGRVRILSQGGAGGGFSAVNGDAGGAAIGEVYEMRLSGEYVAGTLNLTLAVLDEFGDQLGTAATATDTAPLAGDYFGVRNRSGHSTNSLDFDYHEFSVVPEPASAALLAGLTVFGGLVFLRRKRRNG